jgi:hypothetical protein
VTTLTSYPLSVNPLASKTKTRSAPPQESDDITNVIFMAVDQLLVE